MGNQPNYACTACGRTFSTRYSAARHVTNKEQNAASYVPYPSYMAGLRTGTYLAPLPRPGYGKSPNEIVYNEYLHELARQAAIEHFKVPGIRHMTLSMITDGLRRIDRKQTENERREDKVDDRLKMDLFNRINNIKAQGESKLGAASAARTEDKFLHGPAGDPK